MDNMESDYSVLDMLESKILENGTIVIDGLTKELAKRAIEILNSTP